MFADSPRSRTSPRVMAILLPLAVVALTVSPSVSAEDSDVGCGRFFELLRLLIGFRFLAANLALQVA